MKNNNNAVFDLINKSYISCMKSPIVSIIVPVYAVEKYIEDCLRSIMAQSYTDFECLIVDDCGKDRSIDIVQSILLKYDGAASFRIINREKNGGLAAARNSGLKEAKGEYVYFLDSDDYISHDCLEKMVSASTNGKADLVIGSRVAFRDESGEIIQGAPKYSSPLLKFENANVFRNCHEFTNTGIYGIPWNKLYKMSFLRKHGILFEEGLLYEDDLWSYKIYLNSPLIHVISDTTYYYRVRKSSIMSTYSEKHLYSSVKNVEKVEAYSKENPNGKSSYALRSIENFKYGCMLASISKTTDERAFVVLYKKFTSNHRPPLAYWIARAIPFREKVRSAFYLIPIFGKKYLLKIIYSRIAKRANVISPFHAPTEKLHVSNELLTKIFSQE